jgi:hypothetical protein
MSVEEVIAQDLLERLESMVGFRPPIEQVDIWDCDCCCDGCCCGLMYANIYWGSGDEECETLTFDRPEQGFASADVEQTMIRLATMDVQALAAALLRRGRELAGK